MLEVLIERPERGNNVALARVIGTHDHCVVVNLDVSIDNRPEIVDAQAAKFHGFPRVLLVDTYTNATGTGAALLWPMTAFLTLRARRSPQRIFRYEFHPPEIVPLCIGWRPSQLAAPHT